VTLLMALVDLSEAEPCGLPHSTKALALLLTCTKQDLLLALGIQG
jgi:hypothetical protein